MALSDIFINENREDVSDLDGDCGLNDKSSFTPMYKWGAKTTVCDVLMITGHSFHIQRVAWILLTIMI